MMLSLYLVLILFTGYISSITSFRLPPVTEYSYRGSTSVELITLVHPPSYRHRRSDDCTPDHLGVRFTADQQVVELLLHRNYDINVNAPLFINRNGTIAQEIMKHSENVAVYHDLESGSAILVECIPSTRKFELFGTFYNGSEELMIEPEILEGQEEFHAANLDNGQNRETKSTGEKVLENDISKQFSISHHVIYKGKTHRPILSDFIEEAGLHPKYQASTGQSARVKRANTAYQIELLMVADYSAYAFWLAKSSTSAEAKALLRQFYAFVLNGMDLRYKSVTGSGFSITILFAGLYIAENPSDALWTEKRKVPSDSLYQVNASTALNDFNTWIQNKSNLPGHDHAMLFTAYDLLSDDGNNTAAGLVYLNATCKTNSQSVVEDHFDATMISVAAHVLGHSLGAMHDGTLDGKGNLCSPTLVYIMAASVALSNLGTSGFQVNTNVWKFSPCSISYFQAYINTLNSTNCMTTLSLGYNSTALSPYDQQHFGQVYSADTQCQYTRGPDSYLCRNIYDGNYTNMCAAFYCKISGNTSCAISIAAERTSCGDRKWCVAGECLAAAEAPSVNETCPFGNQPGIVVNGQTCTQLVANSSSNCYNYTNSCCGSCQNAYTGINGYCPEYRYAINISTFTISVTIPSTRINQTGYSWNRCKNDSSKAIVSAFCQNISRNEVKWTREQILEYCVPEQPEQASPISSQLHNISKMDINENNLINVLQETNKLIQLQKALTSIDVGYLADILGKVNTVENISKEVLNEVLDTVNTLMKSNSSTIQSAQESSGAANRILKTTEDITNKVEGGTAENPVKIIKPNIASSVWEQVGDRLIGIKLLHGNENFIQNDSLIHLPQEPLERDLLDAAIYFQSDLLNGTQNKLGMTVIWNDTLFKTGSERYKVVSKIMAAQLLQNGVSITHLGKHYVRAVFLSSEEDSRVVCGYWDYTLNQNGGGWASDGCNHTIDKKRHICTCNHLTNFAVLVDLEAKSIPPEHEQALEIITFVGLILSIIGLSFTILTFLCFRHLRKGKGQQTLFCLCIPMLCYSIIFLVGIKRTEFYAPCIVVSVLIHYFILAAFMWMLMEGVLQYLRFVKVLGTYIPKFFIKTSLPAWGIPLVPVIVLLAYDYNLYYGGLGFCWMKLEALYYAFVLPVCLIILVNAIIFIIVIFRICRRPKGMKINQSEWKMAALSLQAALSIFVVLGLTWLFGVVALGGAKLVFQYIFVFLNAFQGFFIFLLFTAREKQVRNHWVRLCCRKPTGHFTSCEQNSSSQDTFSTTVSGINQSSSLTDNRERRLSSSFQDNRRQSSLSQEQIERVQDNGRQQRSTQEGKQDCLNASKGKEEPFSSLQHQKNVEHPFGKNKNIELKQIQIAC